MIRVYRSLEEVPADFGPSALTIGNFDGVHAGHRRILRRVRATAEARELKPSVLTFDPHPTKVVAPARAPLLMTTPEQRCRIMSEEGIEQALILPFDRSIAQLSAEQFVRQILVDRLNAKAVLVGDNFRFGHNQEGNTRSLAELGEQYGFTTEVITAVSLRGSAVSSSILRGLIETGRVARAARLLERPYCLEGQVISGRGIGSKHTVPTLNLDTFCEVLPKTGVYVTRTQDMDDMRTWPSITNVGFRPTFEAEQTLSIETHLLEPLTGESPQRIRLDFLWRLRDERKFENPEALKRQILSDVNRAHSYFRRIKASVRPRLTLAG